MGESSGDVGEARGVRGVGLEQEAPEDPRRAILAMFLISTLIHCPL